MLLSLDWFSTVRAVHLISPFAFRFADTTVERSRLTPLYFTEYQPLWIFFTPAARRMSLLLTLSPMFLFASIWTVFIFSFLSQVTGLRLPKR